MPQGGERMMVELAAKPDDGQRCAIQYMNRLSDFCLRQPFRDDNGAGDVLWVPGQNR